MDLGMGEILLVLLFALLVYGGRLPEVARSLGRSLATLKRSFQETTESVTRDVRDSMDVDSTERPRTVRRVAAPPAGDPAAARAALATEDVSGTPSAETGEAPDARREGVPK